MSLFWFFFIKKFERKKGQYSTRSGYRLHPSESRYESDFSSYGVIPGGGGRGGSKGGGGGGVGSSPATASPTPRGASSTRGRAAAISDCELGSFNLYH